MVTFCSVSGWIRPAWPLGSHSVVADWDPRGFWMPGSPCHGTAPRSAQTEQPANGLFLFLQALGLAVCLSPQNEARALFLVRRRNVWERYREGSADQTVYRVRTRVGLDGPHHLPGQNPQYAPAFALDTRAGILAQWDW
jgi:hypothetical protein